MNKLLIFALFLLGLIYGQGVAAEGEVTTFSATNQGSTWIYLEWTVSVVRSDLVRYTVVVVEDSSTYTVHCFDLNCSFNATFLQPCSLYNFELTPLYDVDGTITPDTPSFTTGETADIVPNPPINGQVSASGSIATISWNAPTNARCIVSYEVCYYPAADANSRVCELTTDTSLQVADFQACAKYSVEIRSRTASGKSSSPFTMLTNAVQGIPGPPTNLYIVEMTPTSANLSWGPPLTNPSCASDYDVNWKVVYQPLLGASAIQPAEKKEVALLWAVVYPLTPCVNYNFSVNANSELNQAGPVSSVYNTSGEITPNAPLDLTVTTTGSNSIYASWTTGDTVCLDHYVICYQSQSNANDRACFNVPGNSYTFSELWSCTNYAIELVAVSPSGLTSTVVIRYTATDDEAPGPPTNLVFVNSTAHSITIDFDMPLINPQCVNRYIISVIDVNATAQGTNDEKRPIMPAAEPDHTNVLDGLRSCTYYFIQVLAESPQGLRSISANTTGSTTDDVPSAPDQLTSSSTSTTSIFLHWYEPLSNPRCVYFYRVIWVNEVGISRSDTVIPGVFENAYTINNLQACMSYDITVVPVMDSGDTGIVAQRTQITQCAV